MEGLEVIELNEVVIPERMNEVPDFIVNSEVKELAPNMEVQAQEIRDVFVEIPELKYDAWKELDIEQRTEILNGFEEEIAEIEMRNTMPVEHEATRSGLMGYYDGQKMVISDTLIGNNSYEAYKEVLDTLFHEGRHAYQYYNLDVARTEPNSELVEAWRVNLKELGYDPADSTLYANQGYYRYFIQPVEVDARTFAETVINKLGV